MFADSAFRHCPAVCALIGALLLVCPLLGGCDRDVSCEETVSTFCSKAAECDLLDGQSEDQCLFFGNLRCETNGGCEMNASFVQSAANQCVEALEFETCEEINGPNSRVPICGLVCQ